ncbi:sigma-70 family RNA polymerase sigma factor [Robertmurraya korlensis]|uniref:sigma-70 family RNA polymerase sigma factor n=1 Tax=Robertmurraya korlensis TaxID=519977 RepID=UPI000826800F|nr:sigma-70 family RNA polymerase sigma factor [Robertmurraya korlensis]
MEHFNEIAKQYEPMIHKIILTLGIYKNQEEFYQTGLIALWQAAKRYDRERGAFSSFAYSYIKGQLQTEMTKRNKHDEHYVSVDDESWASLPDLACQLSFEWEDLDCEGLTEKERKWLMYTVIHGLSVKEIAVLENVSQSAVKLWRSGARNKLRDKFLVPLAEN